VSIIQPDLDTLVREGLFNNEIGGAVLVHVLSRNCECRITRRKRQVPAFAGREMQLNPIHPLAAQDADINKQRSIGFLIIIEISCYQH